MKKVSLLILTLLLSLPLLFSCTGTPEETTEIPEESTAEPRVIYTVAANGATDYTMVRSDVISTEALQAAINLRKAIKEKYGAELSILSDWSKDNKENNTVTSTEDVREILIGDTNRAETRDIAAEYASMVHGYVITARNGKVVIWGSNSDTLAYGINYFAQNLLKDGALEIEEDYLYVWDLSAEGMLLDLIAKEYTVIGASDDSDKVWNAASVLVKDLGALAGKELSLESDSLTPDKSGKEILVGMTDRPESTEAAKDLNYMDYAIRTYENKIVIVGGSPLSTLNATNVFMDLLKTGKLNSLEAGFVYEYDFDPLIADSLAFNIGSFVPSWAGDFTPPAWLTDYEEKLYALTSPTGRMTVDAHRGDTQNYPENSLEGILSAIMMGADVIEIDIRLTKDNVMVLMHDETLTRTTNYSRMKGKNGLPTSAKISDWTYEQLLELRLLKDGEVTDCKIPTMYEAALLFVGRAQIHFDCKISSIDKNSDVYLLAEETGSKESFFYYYGISTMQTWLSYNKGDTEFKAFVAKVRSYLAKSGHALRNRDFNLLTTDTDNIAGWNNQYSLGKKMVVTNKIYDVCKYIAANQEPISIN